MPEYLSPGVYVEEFDSGSPPLEGASTSTAGFIGVAERGRSRGLPQLVTSFADFQRQYGGYLSEAAFQQYRFLSYAVEHFFNNGGSRCYVMRVVPSDAKRAAYEETDVPVKVTAKNEGQWGNKIRWSIAKSSKAKTPIVAVVDETRATYRVKSTVGFYGGDVVTFTDGTTEQVRQVIHAGDQLVQLDKALDGDVVDTQLLPEKWLLTNEVNIEVSYGQEIETYENVSFNQEAPTSFDKVLAKSQLVDVVVDYSVLKASPATAIEQFVSGADTFTFVLENGSDGTAAALSAAEFIGEDAGPGQRTGIRAFIDNDMVSIMAVPGVTDPNVQVALVNHCEGLGSRFAILDLPRDAKKVEDVLTHRDIFDSSYAALYNPWLQVFDPLDKRNIFIPPSGSMAGIYARSDNTRGVQKAPANEVVRGVVGLDCQYNKGEQDILNPRGVNLIRSFTGQGIRVWGARTASSNGLWKYINVRRLFIFLEESIKAGTNWVVFEPNDEQLWARVQRTIDAFLTRVWRDGALMGTTPGEAFYIQIGRQTMTQDDIDNGRLICVIGVAPVKPAEFVIFRLTQKTGGE